MQVFLRAYIQDDFSVPVRRRDWKAFHKEVLKFLEDALNRDYGKDQFKFSFLCSPTDEFCLYVETVQFVATSPQQLFDHVMALPGLKTILDWFSRGVEAYIY